MTKMIQIKKYLKYIFLVLIIITFMFSFPSVIAEGNDDNGGNTGGESGGSTGEHVVDVTEPGEENIGNEVLELCKVKRGISVEQLATRFGLSLTYTGDDNFVIEMDPTAKTADSATLKILKKTKFKIVKINNDTNNNPNIGKEVSYKNDLKLHLTDLIPSSELKDRNGKKLEVIPKQALYIELESDDLVDDSILSEIFEEYPSAHDVKCDTRIYIYLIYATDGKPIVEASVRDLSGTDCSKTDKTALEKAYCDSISNVSLDNVICDSDSDLSRYTPGTINYNFCQAKLFALANGKNYTDKIGDNGKFNKSKSLPTFKCTPKNIRGFSENYTDEQYYTERDYFYANHTSDFNGKSGNGVYYTYHFSPDTATTAEGAKSLSCQVKCEEAVVVEYGPPIAAKAGLCFEYKVKLRSYVNCNMTKKPELPPTYPLCYPSTVCYSIFNANITYAQGGPNENFDSCVDKCDGGKYSDRCSQKCYKEVYGKTSNKSLANSLSFSQKMARAGSVERAGSECLPSNGCYYRQNDGSIIFRGKNACDYATWYLRVYGTSIYDNRVWCQAGTPPRYDYWCFNNYEGIPRRCTRDENGAFCVDPCEFVGCKGNYYLNDGYAEKDYTDNLNTYNSFVSECTAAASCTTSTADFQISVDYSQKEKNGEIKEYTINYPYSVKEEGKDQGNTLKSPKENGKNTPACFTDEGKRTTDTNCDTTILDYNGCYKDIGQKRWYLTEWSFPGTWISNKSHKISYTKQTGRSWIKAKNKFCLLEDALDVNQYWYNYYYKKLADGTELNGTSYNDSKIIDNYCSEYGSQIKNFVENEETAKNITYNIRAHARNFGLFHWDVDIACFYATNSHYSEDYGEGSSYYKDWCNPSPDRYRVRSVDLKNLFPDEKGDYTDSENSAGRLPGFNWSNHANTTKNDKFISLPFEYAKEVQKLGYSVYSSDYLDYYFKLSPSLLKQIRNSSHVYGLYDGDFVTDENGVVTYRSALFRENGSIINAIKGNKPSENTVAAIPSPEALRCNNMVNVGSDECYVVEISEDGN